MTFTPDQQIFVLATVFLSIFGVIGIYNLSLYFVIRRRVLLDYCLFVLAMMLYTSVNLIDVLKIDLNKEDMSVIAAAFAAFGGLVFCRSFFRINAGSYPRLNLSYKVLMGFGLIIIGIQSVTSICFPSSVAVTPFTSYPAAILALLTLLLFVVTSVHLWNKAVSARLFIYTLVPLIIGIGIFVSFWLAYSASGTEMTVVMGITLNTILFSSITLQMVLYSVIIGHNLRHLEKEKLDLQRDVNKRLEQEVALQTASLLKAKEEIENQKRQLEGSNRMKNKLFSLVSHDMRGPLNGLAGLVDVLDRDKIPKEQLALFTAQLKTKINDSVIVLNRLLQWSHAQLDEVKVRKEVFSLNDLVNENITLLHEQLAHKQLKVNKNLTGPEVFADREMIDTIIWNLISNGIKFTGENKSLYISSDKDGNKTRLKIRDEGVGMNPDWFNHLEENEELHSEPGTDGERGVGFGLLICKDFIEMNDGILICESELGKGTTFTMLLESAP